MPLGEQSARMGDSWFKLTLGYWHSNFDLYLGASDFSLVVSLLPGIPQINRLIFLISFISRHHNFTSAIKLGFGFRMQSVRQTTRNKMEK